MNSSIVPEMVALPAGLIVLGIPACPPRANLPWVWPTGRTVEIAAFRLSRFHVTNAQYRAFLDDTRHTPPAYINEPDYHDATQPVVGVSWEDAVAYCTWLSLKTGRSYRLPGDAEWEFAARGGREGMLFPWGNALDPALAAFGGLGAPRPVGSYPPNDFGMYDMTGNAWSWCAERFEEVSGGVKAVNTPTGRDPSENRVLRGGSYMTCHYINLWIAYRHEDPPDLHHESIGFRVAL